jgi:hypothetical protein
MAEREKQEEQELSPDEVEEQQGEQLPDREVLSVINPGVDGVPIIAPEPPAESL